MHKRSGTFLFALLCVTTWWAASAFAVPTSLSIVDPETGLTTITVLNGNPIEAQVVVDDAAIAGASFTVETSPALTPNSTDDAVASDFFDTFVNQDLLDPDSGDPEYVTVTGDSKEYYSPIVDNTPAAGQLMLAAARVDNGSGTNVPIITLHFDAAAAGSYLISIAQSIIDNTDAGYDEAGESIPYLVAINGTNYPSYGSADITTYDATIVVLPYEDLDGDNIDDNWEELYAPPETPAGEELNVFSRSGDYDGDGYSDYQEYLNRNELDPNDSDYDPTFANAAGGTGYTDPDAKPVVIPAINLLLLGN